MQLHKSYHELTRLLAESPCAISDETIANGIIKKWLEEKAHELYLICTIPGTDSAKGIYPVKEILGLTDEPEVKPFKPFKPGDIIPPPKEDSMKWCEHIKMGKDWPYMNTLYYSNGEYRGLHILEEKFCPICGTPRPVEKTLAEKINEWFVNNGMFTKGYDSSFEAKHLAEVAEQHFKERS